MKTDDFATAIDMLNTQNKHIIVHRNLHNMDKDIFLKKKEIQSMNICAFFFFRLCIFG